MNYWPQILALLPGRYGFGYVVKILTNKINHHKIFHTFQFNIVYDFVGIFMRSNQGKQIRAVIFVPLPDLLSILFNFGLTVELQGYFIPFLLLGLIGIFLFVYDM
jgi:hypothetical protein